MRNLFANRHCLAAIAATIVIGLCQPGCNRSAKQADSPQVAAAKVTVAVVEEHTIIRKDDVPTSVEGFEQAPVMAKIDGYIRTVAVNIGDEVKAGQTLIEIEVPELNFADQAALQLKYRANADKAVRDAELRAADANLKEQQALVDLRSSEHARIARLVGGGALKRQKLEEAQFALISSKSTLTSIKELVGVARARVDMATKQIAVAEAEYEKAKAMAGYQKIVAPFDGVITRRNVDPGTYVRPANRGGGTKPLLVIAKTDKVRAVVHLTMKQSQQLKLNDPVKLAVEDLPGRILPGVISRYAKAYDIGTRMMRAEVDLDNPIDAQAGRRLLRPGTYGSLKITVATRTGPVIPKSALKEVKDKKGAIKKYVKVIDPDYKCRIAEVTTSIETKNSDKTKRWVGITSGLKPKDVVVVDYKAPAKNNQQLAADSIVHSLEKFTNSTD